MILNYLRQLLKSKDKKVYTIKFGTPTMEKYGNFSYLDIFIKIDCPLCYDFDYKGINKPIVTPYEVITALNDIEWEPKMLLCTSDLIRMIPKFDNSEVKIKSLEEEKVCIKLPEYINE